MKLVNVSEHSDEEMERRLKASPAFQLALEVGTFIGNQWFVTVAISNTHDGLMMVDYPNRDGILQPTVRIDGRKVIWPTGTDLDLLTAFLQTMAKDKP